jgi:hypothetical protein
MISVVQICNIALSRVGITRTIASLDEDSQEASTCNLLFEPTRDALLRSYPWAFARAEQDLALVEEDPTDDWGYSYRRPTDCLQARRIMLGARIESIPAPFSIGSDSAGQLIYSDETDARLEYTRLVDDVAIWPEDFAQALCWALAAEIALPLSVDEGRRQAAKGEAAMALKEARAKNENEGQEDPPVQSEFIRAREGSTLVRSPDFPPTL